jgi:hypothetical protein
MNNLVGTYEARLCERGLQNVIRSFHKELAQDWLKTAVLNPFV